MKLNITFVPFAVDEEYKVMAYGEKDALVAVIKGLQENHFLTNVYLSDDKKDVN